MKDDLLDEVKESDVRALLSSFKELNLAEHYDFSIDMTSTMKDSEAVANFLKSNRPLIFEISDSNTLYYKTDAGAESKVFDVDVETSFVKSDDWLYSKLIPVSNVFPSVMKGEISNKMTDGLC